MSYVTYQNKMVSYQNKYVHKNPVPDKIEFLTYNSDVITFASLPVITGSKTIRTRMYLKDTNSNFSLGWSPASGNDYLRIDFGVGEAGLALMIEVNFAANRRQYNLTNEGVLGVPFSLEIIKGTGTISSVKFNNIEGTDLGSSLQFGPSDLKRITGGDSSSIWNLEIVGTNKWVGFPYGDTSAAWVDTIGTNHGTVTGSPGTIDLTT